MENTEFNTLLTQGGIKAGMTGCKSADLWKVPRDRIKVLEGFNVRIKNNDYYAQVRLYADSMKADGFFVDKPLTGYVAKENGENVIYVTDGHTRLDAYDLAKIEGADLHDIPMVTKPSGTSMEDLTVALVVSNNGRNLTPYEVALVCKRLINYGMDEVEIATRVGLSKAYVSNLLLLVSAPREICNLVQEGKVSASLAVATLKTHETKALAVLKDGLANAESVGKTKVTEKHLKPKISKAENTPATTPEKKTDLLLSRGVAWIKENLPAGGGAEMLLAFLTGFEVDEINVMVKQIDLEIDSNGPSKEA